MSQPALFRVFIIGFSFIVWGIVVARYLWPQLRGQSRAEAMQPLLILHSFRFVGLSFLVPGVVSPDLPADWARPAAYSDVIAAILALLALAPQEQVRDDAGLGVQRMGLRGPALRLLSGQSRWVRGWSVGCRLLHCNRLRAAAPHHAWAVVPPPLTGRRY